MPETTKCLSRTTALQPQHHRFNADLQADLHETYMFSLGLPRYSGVISCAKDTGLVYSIKLPLVREWWNLVAVAGTVGRVNWIIVNSC